MPRLRAAHEAINFAVADSRHYANGNFGQRLNGDSQEVIGQVGYEWVQGSSSILVMTGVNYITGSSSNPAGTTSTSNPVPGNANRSSNSTQTRQIKR
jgi:hypothetical protein